MQNIILAIGLFAAIAGAVIYIREIEKIRNGKLWLCVIISIVSLIIYGNCKYPDKKPFVESLTPSIASAPVDSLITYNEALVATMKMSHLLQSIKSNSIISPETQYNIYKQIIKYSTISESYYRKTFNCEVGIVLLDFLNYIITINENNLNGNDKEKFQKLIDLKKEIEIKCSDKSSNETTS